MSENVHLEILSVASIQSADRLAGIGRILDSHPDLAPTRMGPRDPARTPVTSVEDQLVAWAPTIRPGDYFNQFMARTGDPVASGLLWITGDIWNFPPIGPHRLEFDVDERWFDTQRAERLDEFADLFRAECESMDAFWGGAGLTSLRRQTNDLVFRAQVERTLDLPGTPGSGWDLRERALPDLYWLNFFGPAYLERWGSEALDEVGVRQASTANGGRVVWATDTPFVFDPSAQRLTDYAWKMAFYERLGMDTILHENWTDPGAGVRVPTYQDHRRFVATG